MSTLERINLHVRQLPRPLQVEVLNFVEFLASKIAGGDSRQPDLLWSQFSISQAMRGLEEEDGPVYDKSDLKEMAVTHQIMHEL